MEQRGSFEVMESCQTITQNGALNNMHNGIGKPNSSFGSATAKRSSKEPRLGRFLHWLENHSPPKVLLTQFDAPQAEKRKGALGPRQKRRVKRSKTTNRSPSTKSR